MEFRLKRKRISEKVKEKRKNIKEKKSDNIKEGK